MDFATFCNEEARLFNSWDNLIWGTALHGFKLPGSVQSFRLKKSSATICACHFLPLWIEACNIQAKNSQNTHLKQSCSSDCTPPRSLSAWIRRSAHRRECASMFCTLCVYHSIKSVHASGGTATGTSSSSFRACTMLLCHAIDRICSHNMTVLWDVSCFWASGSTRNLFLRHGLLMLRAF